jgi:DNA-binding response OmpR family regulator
MTRQWHVLIIEDDPAVGHSLCKGLESHGFRTTWKASGGEGVEFAQKAAPHLVILDVRLPDGSGFDFCRQVRAAGLHMPLVMLTVQHEETDRVLGLEMGADDYVTKPYSLRELVSRLRAHLRRAYGEYSSAEANLLYAGDLVIDLNRGQALRDEKPLNLTPIEFRLLVYLARHPGQALGRAQIVEELWGHSPDADSERAVNVHVRRLREKVELDAGKPELILTVPGIGYRLHP